MHVWLERRDRAGMKMGLQIVGPCRHTVLEVEGGCPQLLLLLLLDRRSLVGRRSCRRRTSLPTRQRAPPAALLVRIVLVVPVVVVVVVVSLRIASCGTIPVREVIGRVAEEWCAHHLGKGVGRPCLVHHL